MIQDAKKEVGHDTQSLNTLSFGPTPGYWMNIKVQPPSCATYSPCQTQI
jgi:hypothetical protein